MSRNAYMPSSYAREEAFTQSSASHLNFSFENATYADYIVWSKKLVQAGRVHLPNQPFDSIEKSIQANIPAESYPTSKPKQGILFIHGLMSSPMGMSSLYQHFAEKNYLVRSVLLPGHGTRPGDLLEVTYQDWLETCRFGIKTLRQEVEHVTVIGFSAGSALALYLSLTENTIDSLVLFAPAISLKHSLSYFYAKTLYPFRQLSTKINWTILKKEEDYAKYQSLPINALYQVTHLINQIHRLNAALQIPLYIVSTQDDETISHSKAIDFFLKQTNILNRGIIYTTDTQLKLPPHLQQRVSSYPEEKILDFSHSALTISPTHPHYGRQGDFADFGHYTQEQRPKQEQQPFVYQGSLSKNNLQNHLMQRLSYNPDFDYLVSDIESFLEECRRR